ncbi:AP2 domain-containing protein [Bacillus anthracis]|uniref:AP2 domain-containing protein n=1 Tax=Bacillus anthracis TaxID=1392 RepID=UPI000D34DD8A|nr:AP2 domain-containing protein [Bacillus anthracis]PTR88688.1 endonuclease [Bacillus anthracis]
MEVILNNGIKILIDEDDLIKLNGANLFLGRKRYIQLEIKNESGKRVKFYLHRIIMNAKKGEYVDHINGDTFDNRKCNLRICSNKENLRNTGKQKGSYTSKYKGVYYNSARGKWVAKIVLDSKTNSKSKSKQFDTEEEAALHYNKLALELHGEFAYLNEVKTCNI